ncbi:hypothetical protein DM790_12160 [Flavobacterium collinsii]|nr:hypothetical protein [Flavobacterium collinsii]
MDGMKVKFLKIKMLKIYKYIYYASFLQSRKVNAAPEITVYSYLCFIQTSNVITILNALLVLTKMNVNYDVRLFAAIGPIFFYFINYYYFSKKGNGKKIIKDQGYSLGKYSFLLDVFGFVSFMMVVATYYVYKEF